MSFDLSGRTALVTGASSGLGEGFAKTIARAGARTALAARRVERVKELAKEINAAGGTAIGVEMDVTEEASVVAAYDAIERAWGTVDTIVGNAGVGIGGAPPTCPSTS